MVLYFVAVVLLLSLFRFFLSVVAEMGEDLDERLGPASFMQEQIVSKGKEHGPDNDALAQYKAAENPPETSRGRMP